MKKRVVWITAVLACLLLCFVLAGCVGSPVKFQLKFIVDGEQYAAIDTAGNETITMPQNPTKEGEKFDGWYWDQDTWQKPFTANSLLDAPLSSDMSVYAKFSLQIKHFSGLALADATFTYDGTEKSLAVTGAPAGAAVVYTGNGQVSTGTYTVTATVSMEEYESETLTATLTIVPDLAAAQIVSAPAFTFDGLNGFISLPNNTESYSFIGQVTISEGATWQISTDMHGVNAIPTKTAPLNAGDNIFYLLVTSGNGENITLYTINVRRRPIYTVSFDTHGGTTVTAQQVEENSLATAPPAATRAGYTFAGWNYDFATPVTQSQTVTANWQVNTYTVTFDANDGDAVAPLQVIYDAAYTLPTPTGGPTGYAFAGWYSGNTQYQSSGTWKTASDILLTAKWAARNDIAYTVKHYQQNINDDEYTLYETQNLQGTADSTVTPATITYTGFTAPQTETVTVSPDGSRVVSYYYTRNSYTMTFVTNGGTAMASAALKYGATLPTATRSGFTFGGWFTDMSLSNVCNTAPAQNVVYAWWQEENKSGDFTYSGTTEITITGYEGTAVAVCIPAYIGGVPVTSIGSSAFSGCTGLTSIIIPDSVTSIGKGAFSGCSSLESITIPFVGAVAGKTAEDTYQYPFGYIFGTSNYTRSTKIWQTYYGSNTSDFTGTNYYIPATLRSVTVTGGSILRGAFQNCTSLMSITIPHSVTSIGVCAFMRCESLTSVTIPDSVTSIGKAAFSVCTSLTSVTIPNSVTSIGDGAFADCTGLTSIAIPDSVTSIGGTAFLGCTKLTTITIPDSVTSIGVGTFEGCTDLMNITVADGNPIYHSVGNCLIETASKTLMRGCNISVIPTDGSVTSIGEFAFYYYTALTSITIPESVTSIGDGAFADCTSLTHINFTGTKAQWNAISKGLDWNRSTGNYIVHCTDGDIPKS